MKIPLHQNLNVYINRKRVCIRLKLEFDYDLFFIKNGYKIIKNAKNADLIIYETCVSTHYTENSCIKDIQKLNEMRRNNSKLIICGCMTKIYEDLIRRKFGKKIILIKNPQDLKKIIKKKVLFLPPKNIFIEKSFLNMNTKFSFLNKILGLKFLKFTIADYFVFFYKNFLNKIYKISDVESGFHILISKGCSNNCSYCAIKLAKGDLKSKTPEKILNEFKDGIRKGYRNFFLHAEDLGCYGKDINCSFLDLLAQIVNYKGDFNINLIGLNIKWLIKDYKFFCRIFDSGKIHRLCVPLQSGNPRILKLMNREYDIKKAKIILKEINNNYPSISLQTHIMVGFPSETFSEFLDSVSLINKLDFDYIQVYKFSPRFGTKAYSYKGKLSEEELDRRSKYIKKCFRRKLLKKYLKNISFGVFK